MTKFRPIFERFANLNLLVLIEDLRRGLVARNFFIDTFNGTLCPLAHGAMEFSARARDYKPLTHLTEEESFFVCWWDDLNFCYGQPTSKNEQLVEMLLGIYQERLDDADAVQKVMEQLPEGVAV